MAIDPVCGMECDPSSSEKAEYEGKIYYFCAPGCKQAFEQDPEKYLTAYRQGEQQGEHHGMPHGGHHRGHAGHHR